MSLISRHSYKLIAENLDVTETWQEIPVLLKAQKRKQELTLGFGGARLSLEEDVIETSEGVKIEAFVEIKDTDGNWQSLSKGSYKISDINIDQDLATLSGISFSVNTAPHKDFVAVRIRASQPIKCKSVRWHCYYPK